MFFGHRIHSEVSETEMEENQRNYPYWHRIFDNSARIPIFKLAMPFYYYYYLFLCECASFFYSICRRSTLDDIQI